MPVPGPFPGVAEDVVQAPRVGQEAADRVDGGLRVAQVPGESVGRGRGVAAILIRCDHPGVGRVDRAGGLCARCVLPLGLGGQAVAVAVEADEGGFGRRVEAGVVEGVLGTLGVEVAGDETVLGGEAVRVGDRLVPGHVVDGAFVTPLAGVLAPEHPRPLAAVDLHGLDEECTGQDDLVLGLIAATEELIARAPHLERSGRGADPALGDDGPLGAGVAGRVGDAVAVVVQAIADLGADDRHDRVADRAAFGVADDRPVGLAQPVVHRACAAEGELLLRLLVEPGEALVDLAIAVVVQAVAALLGEGAARATGVDLVGRAAVGLVPFAVAVLVDGVVAQLGGGRVVGDTARGVVLAGQRAESADAVPPGVAGFDGEVLVHEAIAVVVEPIAEVLGLRLALAAAVEALRAAVDEVVVRDAIAVVVEAVADLGDRLGRRCVADRGVLIDAADHVAAGLAAHLVAQHAVGTDPEVVVRAGDGEVLVRLAIAVVVEPIAGLVRREAGLDVAAVLAVDAELLAGPGASPLADRASAVADSIFVRLAIAVVVEPVAGVGGRARRHDLCVALGRAVEVALDHAIAGTDALAEAAGGAEAELLVGQGVHPGEALVDLAVAVVVVGVAPFGVVRIFGYARDGAADAAQVAPGAESPLVVGQPGVAEASLGHPVLVGFAVAVIVDAVAVGVHAGRGPIVCADRIGVAFVADAVVIAIGLPKVEGVGAVVADVAVAVVVDVRLVDVEVVRAVVERVADAVAVHIAFARERGAFGAVDGSVAVVVLPVAQLFARARVVDEAVPVPARVAGDGADPPAVAGPGRGVGRRGGGDEDGAGRADVAGAHAVGAHGPDVRRRVREGIAGQGVGGSRVGRGRVVGRRTRPLTVDAVLLALGAGLALEVLVRLAVAVVVLAVADLFRRRGGVGLRVGGRAGVAGGAGVSALGQRRVGRAQGLVGVGRCTGHQPQQGRGRDDRVPHCHPSSLFAATPSSRVASWVSSSTSSCVHCSHWLQVSLSASHRSHPSGTPSSSQSASPQKQA